MPKQKTHKGLAKRVRITAKGKFKKNPAGAGHLLSAKSGNRRRKLRKANLTATCEFPRLRRLAGLK